MCKAVVCYIQIKFFQYNQKSLGHLSYLDEKLIKKFVLSSLDRLIDEMRPVLLLSIQVIVHFF